MNLAKRSPFSKTVMDLENKKKSLTFNLEWKLSHTNKKKILLQHSLVEQEMAQPTT